MSVTWKRLICNLGLLLALAGLLVSPVLGILWLATAFVSETPLYGIPILVFMVLVPGAGLVAFSQANGSLKGKPSRPMRLLSPAAALGTFITLMLIGLLITNQKIVSDLFLPPVFLILAALPPLAAVAWFMPKHPVSDGAGQSQQTWRRGLLAFFGGATVSVFMALVLEILVPLVSLSLIADAARHVLARLNDFSLTNGGRGIISALNDPFFVYLFIEIAVIAPLVEELVKPLVTLPLLRTLNRQETFWVGALAGAGFAMIENVIYGTGWFSIWAGVFILRAIGGALHPLGSGLVALGWRDVLRGEPGATNRWFKQYALAVLIHAIWNGGSLLVITLGGARFFGDLPPEIGILGTSMGSITLAFLIILGVGSLWIGRAYGHDRPLIAAPTTDGDAPSEAGFAPSERALALWALACLLAIVPMGILGFRLWVH